MPKEISPKCVHKDKCKTQLKEKLHTIYSNVELDVYKRQAVRLLVRVPATDYRR